MTPFARSLPLLPGRRAGACALAALASLLVALTCLLVAAPAQAVVTEVEGTKVGLQPRRTELGSTKAERASFGNENGNVVLGPHSDYAIFWEPQENDQFLHEWITNVDGYFQGIERASLGTPFGDLSQYRDRSNAIRKYSALFKGSYSDTVKYPAAGCTDPNIVEVSVTCLTDAQLREQLQSFIAAHNLPTGMNTIYYLLTPPGVTVCLDAAGEHCSDYALSKPEETEGKYLSTSYKQSFCSYHGAINPDAAVEGDAKTVLYAAIPWSIGLLGLEPLTVHNHGYDCQDGGWNPEKNEETPETSPPYTKEEKEKLEKDSPEVRANEEKAHRLLGPHQEEPNQEGKSESGGYGAGLSDLLINQIGEEEMNTITDPLLASWQNGEGLEATDLCRNVFANTGGEGVTGHSASNLETEAGTLSNLTMAARRYYINNVFSLSNDHCEGAVGLVPRFTAPDPVNAGEIVGVDGMESTVTLIKGEAFGASGPPTTTYATYSWNFGDGSPEVKGYAPGAPVCEAPWLSPCAASAFHSYTYGGTYTVTLTITDVGGDTTSVSHEVTVVGPAPPPPPPPPTPPATTSASTGSGSGSGSGAGTTPPTPAPVAADAVLSRSLRNVARHGVQVRYSVNEQVAGHFELLLERTLAHRLGISGPLAVGLPAGTPPQVVIGKALLVTTKAGRSTTTIQVSPRTAARLARLHSVTMLLRLIVRNASHAPLTTTVLSSFTLVH